MYLVEPATSEPFRNTLVKRLIKFFAPIEVTAVAVSAAGLDNLSFPGDLCAYTLAFCGALEVLHRLSRPFLPSSVFCFSVLGSLDLLVLFGSLDTSWFLILD